MPSDAPAADPDRADGGRRRDQQVEQLDQGMVMKGAVKFQKVAQASGVPRDNH